MLSDAEKNADKIKRDAVMEAKEKSYQLKLEVDKDIKEKKAELKDSENKLLQRESSLDKRDELCQKREATLDEREEKTKDGLMLNYIAEIYKRDLQIKQQVELIEKLKSENEEYQKSIETLYQQRSLLEKKLKKHND